MDDNELSSEWTLGDVYDTGDDATKKEITDLLQAHSDYLASSIDQDQLKMVRSGGHLVRPANRQGEVQVTIYRSGPAYGMWSFGHSPEGHEVRIEHSIPTSYRPDGGFDTGKLDKSWVVSAADWRRLGQEGFVGHYIGKKIAKEVASVFRLPLTVAPDALAG